MVKPVDSPEECDQVLARSSGSVALLIGFFIAAILIAIGDATARHDACLCPDPQPEDCR